MNPNTLDTPEIHQLLSVYRDGLLEDVLPFWIKNGVDREFGGVITSLDRHGAIVDTDKCVWQQGRFTWLLGELYNNVQQNGNWLAIAERNLGFLDQYAFDPTDGRMWFHLTRKGNPIRKRRYAFTESFAAMAYGEIAQATENTRYKEKAEQCFQRFIDHNAAPAANPKYTDTRPMQSIGVPMITIGVAQELRGSIGLDSADEWIEKSIEKIKTDFVKPEIQCVMETVGPNGETIDHFDGRTLNPGHAIEAAWFVLREGEHRDDSDLVKLGCQMLQWMWKRGWDKKFGGLFYFTGVDERPVQEYWHDMKFWWPHNEAIIATLMAYHLTGESGFADMHRQVHDWTYSRFPDSEHGEWFGYLRRDGSVSSFLKGNLWKGPFHIPRMQLVCWQTLSKLLEAKKSL